MSYCFSSSELYVGSDAPWPPVVISTPTPTPMPPAPTPAPSTPSSPSPTPIPASSSSPQPSTLPIFCNGNNTCAVYPNGTITILDDVVLSGVYHPLLSLPSVLTSQGDISIDSDRTWIFSTSVTIDGKVQLNTFGGIVVGGISSFMFTLCAQFFRKSHHFE